MWRTVEQCLEEPSNGNLNLEIWKSDVLLYTTVRCIHENQPSGFLCLLQHFSKTDVCTFFFLLLLFFTLKLNHRHVIVVSSGFCFEYVLCIPSNQPRKSLSHFQVTKAFPDYVWTTRIFWQILIKIQLELLNFHTCTLSFFKILDTKCVYSDEERTNVIVKSCNLSIEHK